MGGTKQLNTLKKLYVDADVRDFFGCHEVK